MTLHEAIDALIDAAESGNTIVMQRAIAEARAAQADYADEVEDEVVPEDLADEAPEAPEAPEASEAPEADQNPANPDE